jgi:glycine dehydrogenase subunit 1
MTNFLPHTDADRQAMLAAIGVPSQDALFADIPEVLRKDMTYQVLPKQGLSELELQQALKELANANEAKDFAGFIGGGAYNRFIPMAVNTIAGRSEFYTAYTPYQPEISQGTLQVVYEFQSMISELTGMDVANASVYDGGTAVAEAAFMAVRLTKRKRILIARGVHPDYRQILRTYVNGLGEVNLEEYEPSRIAELEGKDVACVILQQPDFWGCVEDVEPLHDFCRANGALFVVSADPISLGLLKAPGSYGADIVVGDIQPLGNNLSFGGPYGGYMATKTEYMRQLPGRLVGRTLDKDGRPCYTLTLQTREQHIRREKATSNICTNQALNVLKATVYLALVGPKGLRHLAHLSVQRAHDLAERLTALEGVELLFPGKPFFSEFVLKLPVPAEEVLKGLAQHRIAGGIATGRFYPEYPDTLLISLTEMVTPQQMDAYHRAFSALLVSKSLKRNPSASPSVGHRTAPTQNQSYAVEVC